MSPRLERTGGWLLAGLALGWLLLRFGSMAWVPLADTSEPRYAEIARLMAVSGDWITPWFEPGVPFWGKPPLAFWAQAASAQSLGVSAWALRLPSWLALLGMALTTWALARAWAGPRAAGWSALILCTTLLPYIAAGAVLTDPFFALGTTLCLGGLMLPQRGWRALAVLGLAIGLLAKGPLTLVLALTPWLLCRVRFRHRPRPALPLRWLAAALLVLAVLVVPWYWLAEIKTPGFLDYFLVGEHLRRYLEPGWQGDLYGTAHLRPYGSIWLDSLLALFPWGWIGLGLLLATLRQPAGRHRLWQALQDPTTTYLVCWLLVPLLFFTFAHNVLWTYVLPCAPALALLLGRVIAQREPHWQHPQRWRRGLLGAAALVPVSVLAIGIATGLNPNLLKTERELVAYVQQQAPAGTPLWYVDQRPFSARFYSGGTAVLVSGADLLAAAQAAPQDLYLAIARDDFPAWQARLPLEAIPAAASKRFMLARLPATRPDTAPAVARSAPPAPPASTQTSLRTGS